MSAAAARASSRRSVSHSIPDGFKKTRKDHASEIAEDYVELIDDLINEFGEARLVDVAERIGVTSVTANKTIARLQRDGFVEKRPYRAIFLTDAGKKLADEMRRRHAIVFEFLLALGVSERQARIDAEGIEHHISSATLKAMTGFLAERG